MKVLVLESDAGFVTQIVQVFEGTEFQISLANRQEDAEFILNSETQDIVLVHITENVESMIGLIQSLADKFPYVSFGFIVPSPLPPGVQLLAPLAALGFIEVPLTLDKFRQALHGARTIPMENPTLSRGSTVVSHSLPNLKGTDFLSNQDLRDLASLKKLEGQVVGPYRVGKKIASDQKGTLYEATQVSINRPVALKVLRPEYYSDQEAVEEFRNFVSAMVKAQNPYITTVFEAGQANGLIFYARERVQGENLRHKVEKREFLTEDRALVMATHVAEAFN
jgi:hypothetical protein